ncbi:MAG: hypothetical protein ACD_60C00028G0062 [uncultured bacterium]|nr:MAG: hypothetical protein ACD_60C00028G0062 [uncultured bacterium]
MKLFFIVGTRPEVIKLAPLILLAKKKQMNVAVCATGQHREILQQALASFNIIPDYVLDVMEVNQSLTQLTHRLIPLLSEKIVAYQPDWVIVQGDTTSAFVGSLMAFYQGVKVAHVEAGLRTYNLQSPFPEELNRQLISKIAVLHFAPTRQAANHLAAEGISAKNIFVTGNTVVDAVKTIAENWQQTFPKLPAVLEEIVRDEKRKLILVTCHRRESFGEPLVNICRAVRSLCEKYPECSIIFAVHPNPNVKEVVFRELNRVPHIYLVDPLEYEAALYVLSRAKLVLTDSGGIQEEAPSFAVPVVVMRHHTERQEGIEKNFALLAGTDAQKIIVAASYYLESPTLQETLAKKINPYGDGKASERILAVLAGQSVEAFYG